MKTILILFFFFFCQFILSTCNAGNSEHHIYIFTAFFRCQEMHESAAVNQFENALILNCMLIMKIFTRFIVNLILILGKNESLSIETNKF